MIQLKNTLSALSLCLLWFLCSCEQEHETIEANRVAASFTPAIAEIAQVETSPAESWSSATTRVDNNQWTNNDIIGIIALNADGSSITNDGFRKYEPSITGTRTQLIPVRDDELADQTIYFPTNGDEVTFNAFAPYQEPDNNTVTYELDGQSTTSNIMESLDFIFHRGQKAYSQASPIVAMNFRHKLSRVVINLTRGSGYDSSLAGTVAEIQGVYTSVSCDVRTGSVSALGDGNINPYRSTTADGEVTFQAIVTPQSDSEPLAEDRILVFTVNNQIYSQEIPQNWETAKSYTYNFTLDANGITLTGSTVVSWGAGTVAWNGNYSISTFPSSFALTSDASTNNSLIIKTTYTSTPSIQFSSNATNISETSDLAQSSFNRIGTTTDPYVYELKFVCTDTTIARNIYIHVTTGTQTLVVPVSQTTQTLSQVAMIQPSSNCYIVAPGSAPIAIPVSRANEFANGIIGEATEFGCELVWADIDGGNGTGIGGTGCVSKIETIGTGSSGYVVVHPGQREGNAVVAVTVGIGDTRIKWSWHIWVTSYNPISNPKVYTNTNGVTNTFMDRNLGAIHPNGSNILQWGSPESLGLYYQWGRKDPFPGSTSTTSNSEKTVYTASGTTTVNANKTNNNNPGVSIATAIQNPLVYYYYTTGDYYDWCSVNDGNTRWGYDPFTKSIYDPCPVGWRIPDRYAWVGHTTANFIYTEIPSGRYHEQTGWWPRSGFRDSSSGSIGGITIGGYWWSATPSADDVLYPDRGVNVFFNADAISFAGVTNTNRAAGRAVRCVAE